MRNFLRREMASGLAAVQLYRFGSIRKRTHFSAHQIGRALQAIAKLLVAGCHFWAPRISAFPFPRSHFRGEFSFSFYFHILFSFSIFTFLGRPATARQARVFKMRVPDSATRDSDRWDSPFARAASKD